MSGTDKKTSSAPKRGQSLERLHKSAYAYYESAHSVTTATAPASGVRRLLSAALLTSTSMLVMSGMGATSASAATVCNTAGTPTIICSGNAGAYPGNFVGNNINVTSDNSWVQDTTPNNIAVSRSSNSGLRISGASDSGTITNNGTITTGETGTNQGGHHGIYAQTTTTARAYNTGSITTSSEYSAGVQASSYGGVATAINRAGGIVSTSGHGSYGVNAYGNTATARNYGAVNTSGDFSHGVEASTRAAMGVATVSNAGTINLTGDRDTKGLAAYGPTVSLTNTGTVTVTGSNSHGVFGSSSVPQTTTINNSATVTASGNYSVGILGTGPTVNITNSNSGVVSGGTYGAGIVFMPTNFYDGMTVVGGSATVVNNGIVNGDVTSTPPGMRIGGARVRNTATVTNTGTINGAIRTEGSMIANIINNGGTVGDNSIAISTGYSGDDKVTITGTGNIINGTIRDARPFGPAFGNTLTFSQSDTVRLTQGQSNEYVGFYSINGFDEIRFNSGTTEFVGDNLIGANVGPMNIGSTAVTVGPGATFRTSGGTTTFGRANEGIVFGGTLNATGAGTQRATVDVPAVGRLNFTGDVTFGDKGRFKVGIAGQNNAGYLQGNNITFNAGSEIYADLTRGIELTDGQGIKVANATNMLTDNGANVYDNSALVNFTKSVVGNDLFLIPQRGVRAVPASSNNRGSSNARNIAAAIDAFIDTAPTDNPIVQFLAQFPVEQQEERLAQLVQDTLPEESGATGSASVVSTDMVIDLIMERLSGGGFNVVDSGQGTGNGGGQTGVAAGDLFLGTDANLALWGRVGGSFAEFTPSGVNGFDSNTYAISIGIDGDITPEMRFGLAGFYSDTDVDENGTNPNSGQQIEGLGVLAYASWRPKDWYVNGTVGYGHNQYKSQRTAAGAQHTASFDGTQLMSRVEAGRIFQFDDGALDITPHVGLRANKLWLDGYTESGPVPTTVNSQNITSVRAVAGVGARYTFEYDNGSRFLPEGYVRGLQELADPSQPITGSVVGGGQFVSTPTERDDFSYAVGAGFTYEFTDVFSVRLLYDGEFQDDYREDSVTAAIRVEF